MNQVNDTSMLDTPSSPDDWTWPLRWDAAVRFATITGAAVSRFVQSPLLAPHRELDRLSALARAVHRGEANADLRLQDSLRRLLRVAPSLVEFASQVESLIADSDRIAARPGASEATEATEGFVDDGGVSVLLATVAAVVDMDATKLVIGLTAAAMASETVIPGAVRDVDPSSVRDLDVLATRFADAPSSEPNVPMQALSGHIGGPGGIPGLGALPGQGGGVPGEWPGTDPFFDFDPEIIDHMPVELFTPVEMIGQRWIERMVRLLELRSLLVPEPPPPRLPPGAPVTWTTGIEGTMVTSPCRTQRRLTIRGHGFGSTPAPGVGVVAPSWDPARKQVVCRPVPILTWSDTEVTVRLPPLAVGGVVGFADVAWIAAYDAWVERENARVREILATAAGTGEKPPEGLVIRQPWSECLLEAVTGVTYKAGRPYLVVDKTATYKAGYPYLVVEVVPLGGPRPKWRADSVLLRPGEPFRLNWTTANATEVRLEELSPSFGVLAASGKPSSYNVAATGSELLTAPAEPRRIELQLTASNECGYALTSASAVVVGPPLAAPTLTAVAPIPGGDVDTVWINGKETLQPNTRLTTRSIPLVAGKRTVLRIDWQIAVPQAPPEDAVIVTASVWAEVPSYPGGPVSVRLYPQADTGKSAPAWPPIELRPARAYTSMYSYLYWQSSTAGNATLNPGTFNFVLPAGLAVGDVTLTCYVRARSPGTKAGGDDLYYNASATTNLRFHQRRNIRFRYQRWYSDTVTAPEDDTCWKALRTDGTLLPIPDPSILALSPNAVTQGFRLVEDLFAMKSATPGASGPEEIWFAMGDFGQGGIAGGILEPTQWTGATEPTRGVTAHEVAHMFEQIHLNHCGPNDGEPLSAFPDGGKVLVTGWDQWANQEILGAWDLMTYCWGNAWMSPERWRRLFLKVGQ